MVFYGCVIVVVIERKHEYLDLREFKGKGAFHFLDDFSSYGLASVVSLCLSVVVRRITRSLPPYLLMRLVLMV